MRRPQSRCKECMAEYNRTHREPGRRYDRRKYEEARADPETWAARLAEQAEGYTRLVADPERYAARLEQIREAKRRRNGVTPERYRRPRAPRTPTSTLPCAPLAAWLEVELPRRGVSSESLAALAGSSGRRIRAILGREQENVELDTVDRITLALDARIEDVYGEAEAA